MTRRLLPWVRSAASARVRASTTPYTAADTGFTSQLVDLVADHDDGLLAAYVHDESTVSYQRLRAGLAVQTRRALVHPVFFGSAITGAGVAALTGGIRELLPAAEGDADGPVSGNVFKIERGPAGEKIAYVRMFSGRVRVRDTLQYTDQKGKVTAIHVFDRGSAVQQPSVGAGQIGKLWGLGKIQIGDAIGLSRTNGAKPQFGPPTLETVVVPIRPADRRALYVALAQLAEQDPLINLRQDDLRQEVYVSLYGEVQKEVIQATLADDYGIDVDLPRDHHDLHRTADRLRRGLRDHRHPDQPIPRDRGATHRPGAGRQWRGIPAGG